VVIHRGDSLDIALVLRPSPAGPLCGRLLGSPYGTGRPRTVRGTRFRRTRRTRWFWLLGTSHAPPSSLAFSYADPAVLDFGYLSGHPGYFTGVERVSQGSASACGSLFAPGPGPLPCRAPCRRVRGITRHPIREVLVYPQDSMGRLRFRRSGAIRRTETGTGPGSRARSPVISPMATF
jgi:hypothetical protein